MSDDKHYRSRCMGNDEIYRNLPYHRGGRRFHQAATRFQQPHLPLPPSLPSLPYPPYPPYPPYSPLFYSNQFPNMQFRHASPPSRFFYPMHYSPTFRFHPYNVFSPPPYLYAYPYFYSQYFPMPEVHKAMYRNSGFQNMTYSRYSAPLEAQGLQNNNNVQQFQTNMQMTGTINNNNLFTHDNVQIDYTSDDMNNNVVSPLHPIENPRIQCPDLHSNHTGCATTAVHSDCNSYNSVINASNNVYQTTETVASTGNITSTSTNSTITHNKSTAVYTTTLNQSSGEYSTRFRLKETNSVQVSEPKAINGTGNNLPDGNNYESDMNHSYENWNYGNKNESNLNEKNSRENYNNKMVENSNEFNEYLIDVTMKSDSVPENLSIQNSASNSLHIPKHTTNLTLHNRNTSLTENTDELKFLNENLIQIGNTYYSRTAKQNKSIYVNPNLIPTFNEATSKSRENNLNDNLESIETPNDVGTRKTGEDADNLNKSTDESYGNYKDKSEEKDMYHAENVKNLLLNIDNYLNSSDYVHSRIDKDSKDSMVIDPNSFTNEFDENIEDMNNNFKNKREQISADDEKSGMNNMHTAGNNNDMLISNKNYHNWHDGIYSRIDKDSEDLVDIDPISVIGMVEENREDMNKEYGNTEKQKIDVDKSETDNINHEDNVKNLLVPIDNYQNSFACVHSWIDKDSKDAIVIDPNKATIQVQESEEDRNKEYENKMEHTSTVDEKSEMNDIYHEEKAHSLLLRKEDCSTLTDCVDSRVNNDSEEPIASSGPICTENSSIVQIELVDKVDCKISLYGGDNKLDRHGELNLLTEEVEPSKMNF